MVPVCYPSKISSTTGLREAVVFALSSVTGLVRWTDYIPVKLVASADAALEGRTDAGGFIPMDMLSSNTGLMGWVDYLPVYVDNSATDAWAITATGFIPYAASGGGSSPAFTVTMTALSNALGTVTTLAYINGGGGGGTITIPAAASIASRSSLNSGGHVYFDASGTTHSTISDTEHELFYAWDFGDDVSETWAYGTNTSQNKNAAYGPQAAHVYKSAGTKTWTLVVIDGAGGTSTRTGTITVSAWAEADTYYVAYGTTPTAGANGVGSGAAGYINTTSLTTALSYCANGKRVLLRKGDTWTASGQITKTNLSNMEIGAYGLSGANPIINSTTTTTYDTVLAFAGTSGSDVRVRNLTFTRATADVETWCVTNLGTPHFTLHGCEISGNYTGIGFGITPLQLVDACCISECNVHDICTGNTDGGGISGWGAYLESMSRLAIIGSYWDNALTSHLVRIPGCNIGCIANNYFGRARRGWGGSSGHVLTIRGFTNTPMDTFAGVYVEKIVIRDNVFSTNVDNLSQIQLAPQNDSDNVRHRNIIIENNYFDTTSTRPINTEVQSRLTIRNNIVKGSTFGEMVYILAGSDVGVPVPTDTKVYNNTVWKTSTGGFSLVNATTEAGQSSGSSGTIIKNNLVYAPSATSPTVAVSNGPHTSTWTASNNSTPSQMTSTKPWAAAAPATYAEYAPNGYGINGGTSVPVIKDFFNATISGTRDIGAVQA